MPDSFLSSPLVLESLGLSCQLFALSSRTSWVILSSVRALNALSALLSPTFLSPAWISCLTFRLTMYLTSSLRFLLEFPNLTWSEMKVAQSCLTLYDPLDYTVHGILQAFPSPWDTSQPWDQTQVSCITGRFFTCWATAHTLNQIPASSTPSCIHICTCSLRFSHLKKVLPSFCSLRQNPRSHPQFLSFSLISYPVHQQILSIRLQSKSRLNIFCHFQATPWSLLLSSVFWVIVKSPN